MAWRKPSPTLPPTEAPITTVMLLEFQQPRLLQLFFLLLQILGGRFFFPQLQQKDWVAPRKLFDMKTRIETDFTQNKDEVRNAIYHLYFPGFQRIQRLRRHP